MRIHRKSSTSSFSSMEMSGSLEGTTKRYSVLRWPLAQDKWADVIWADRTGSQPAFSSQKGSVCITLARHTIRVYNLLRGTVIMAGSRSTLEKESRADRSDQARSGCGPDGHKDK
ncbi:uncharacterized protein LOC144003841 [Festucalex cinctus]